MTEALLAWRDTAYLSGWVSVSGLLRLDRILNVDTYERNNWLMEVRDASERRNG